MAGSKKHKWIKTTKENKNYLGGSGFKRYPPLSAKPKSINVGDLDEQAEKLAVKGLIVKDSNSFKVDLGKMGVGKLLGSGKVSGKFAVTVESASKRAVEKVEAAGGSVTVTAPAGGDEFVEEESASEEESSSEPEAESAKQESSSNESESNSRPKGGAGESVDESGVSEADA